jgi:hypothetical protein
MPALAKRMLIFCTGLCLLILFCISQNTYAQDLTSQQILLKLKSNSDSLNKNFAPEKVHMQFDKPYYALGDTIWFKAWLINTPSFLLSAKSGLLHVEIATDSNKVIQQFLLPVANGVTWGNIAINDKEYKAGTYVIRVYTNWMRNFGEETFYYKRINITPIYEDGWLVNSKIKQSIVNAKPSVQAVLQFKNLDQSPIVGKPVSLQVMSGKKTLYKQVWDTDLFGSMDISFASPQKTHGLYIVAESDTKDRKAIIPLNLNNSENTDLQFMPEGGSMVAGLPVRIGFKAISEDGRGEDIKGIITDSKGVQVASFQSAHKGMGSFTMDVKAGEVYSAKVVLPGGIAKAYPLPVTVSSGIVLQVVNPVESDSVKLTLAATNDIIQKRANYFLVAKARGIVCYAAIVSFQNKKAMHRVIAKNLFPTGITRFILMTEKGVPLNERLVYIDQKTDNLNISFKTDNAQIAPKDSISLNLAVTDYTGQPVAGNFAISVTDDALVNTDTLQNDNIFTNLLLTSDLKGYVEQPAYYFQRNAIVWQALDNLLLTQGWVNYELPTGIIYSAETGYNVTGSISNIFNKPISKAKITMLTMQPTMVNDTLVDVNGKFKFKLPLLDTPVFVFKATRNNGKTINSSITIDEFVPPVSKAPKVTGEMPWYVNSNDTLSSYIKANVSLKREQEKLPEGVRSLKEVNIIAKKIIRGSNNLNGPGNADQVLDEKDMEKAGKTTLFDLLEQRVDGFRPGSLWVPRGIFKDLIQWWYVKDKWAVFIIDGIPLYRLVSLPDPMHLGLKKYFKSFTAESIKGIEVNLSSKYNLKYMSRFAPQMNIAYLDFVFIEITTRSGRGPLIDEDGSVYLYKPLPLTLPKQFYKPRYSVTDFATATENRSTINWEPNIITDAAGQATIKFNAAAKPSTYTIIAQGVDFNGNIGYHYQKIIISKPAISNK